MKFNNLFILQLGQNRSKILHSYQQDIPTWLPKIKVISSFSILNLKKYLGNISII